MSSSTANTRNYRNNKKILEVRELIQNKPESEIVKVLEVFDNDVGKTIDAFITDGGKEALAKWSEIQSNKKLTNGKKLPNGNKKSNPDNDNNTQQQPQQQPQQTSIANDISNETVNGDGVSPKNSKNESKSPRPRNDNRKSQQNRQQQQQQQQQSQPQQPSIRKINDLVSSIISQCTATNTAEHQAAISNANANNVNNTNNLNHHNNTDDLSSIPQINSFNVSKDILDDLNNLIVSNQTSLLAKTMGGLKVTVLGIEQADNNIRANKSESPVLSSSVSSTPSSMSIVSSPSDKQPQPQQQQQQQHQPQQNQTGRPPLLNINQQQQQQQILLNNFNNLNSLNDLNKKINKSLINPNSKVILEKSQKDLQRQAIVLAKISSTFQEEFNKSQNLLNQTFNQLRDVLNERQNELQNQLNSIVQNANQILTHRLNKVAELKILSENSIHLNNDQANDLKVDIKHFISERHLDEEFSKINIFQEANFEKLIEAISSFGHVAQINNQYAKERPQYDDLNQSSQQTPRQTPIQQQNHQPVAQINNNSKPSSNNNNIGTVKAAPELNNVKQNGNNSSNKNKNIATINGDHNAVSSTSNSDLDSSKNGGFIEVKKPQRNRNKVPPPQQQQPQQPQQQQPNQNQQLQNNHLNNNNNNNNLVNGKVLLQQNGVSSLPLNANSINSIQKPPRRSNNNNNNNTNNNRLPATNGYHN